MDPIREDWVKMIVLIVWSDSYPDLSRTYAFIIHNVLW